MEYMLALGELEQEFTYACTFRRKNIIDGVKTKHYTLSSSNIFSSSIAPIGGNDVPLKSLSLLGILHNIDRLALRMLSWTYNVILNKIW